MVLRRSKLFAIQSIGCSIIFVAFGFLGAYQLLFDRGERTLEDWYLQIGSVVAIPLFSYAAVFIALKLRDKRPYLSVDEQGIFTTWSEYGLIHWNEIRAVKSVQIQASPTTSIRYLIVEPKNLEELLERLPPKAKKRAQKVIKQYGGLGIPIQGLTAKPQEAADAIAEYASQMVLAKAEAPPIAAG